jgi:phage protein D
MADLPQDISRPSFAVLVDGTALPVALTLSVVRIGVEEDVGVPGMFVIELAGGDADDATAWLDDGPFTIGAPVEVRIGYGETPKPLIVGEVTGLEPAFIRGGFPSLVVRGYDRRHRLMRGRATRSFVQQKDSDIAAAIASDAGLTAQVVDSQVTHDYVLQANATNMDFLSERARRIQYEVAIDDKTLLFRPVPNGQSETLILTPESDLLEFYPRLSSMGQVSEVELRGWSLKDKKQIVARAQSGDEVSTMGGEESGAAMSERVFGAAGVVLNDMPVATQAEADQLVRAQFNRSVLALVTGEGVCTGRPDLHAGQVIKIEGIGVGFSGQYYVTSTRHRYSHQDSYKTHFVVRRNAA